MRAFPHDDRWWNAEWARAAAFLCLALTLAAAALDRRNAILDRIEAPSSQAAPPASPLTSEAMVQEMMTHD